MKNLITRDEAYYNKTLASFIETWQYQSPIENAKIEYCEELSYTLDIKDLILYAKELGEIFERLSKELNSSIIFVLDLDAPWLYKSKYFQPENKALAYLKELGVTKEFVGGFKFKDKELAKFVSHLFWIRRCNASLPNCWFSSEEHKFVGLFTKQCNLHFFNYSAEIKETIESFAQANALIETSR